MALNPIKNYMKNLGKSVMFATADIAGESMTSTAELLSDNKEFFTSTYATLKNPPQAIKRGIQSIQQSKIYTALDYGAKNAVSDLRTGNFYNKEREDRDLLKLAGLDTDDWNDLSEFGVENDWESSVGKSSSSNEITAGDKKIVQSVEATSAASTSTIVNAQITTANSQIKAGRANTAMLYMQQQQLFQGLHADISAVDSTMRSINNLLATSLQNIDTNMANFFTQSLKLDTERNAILKEMLEMQRNQYKSAAQKEAESALKKKPGKARWKDVALSGGGLNFDAYFDAVKKNITSEISNMGIAGFGDDSNMLATFMVSPLKGAVKTMVDAVIPATVKTAMSQLDESISGIFGNIIGRLDNARNDRGGKGGGILGFLGRIFGVGVSPNSKIDTSKYEKGPVPFDGITRKAITDVIPTYLRRIEAALTGRPEEGFDYSSGTWKTMHDAKNEHKAVHENAVKNATADLRQGTAAARKAVKFDSKDDQKDWDKAWDQFWDYLYEMNGQFYPDRNADYNAIPIDKRELRKYYNQIAFIFANYDMATIENRYGRKVKRRTNAAKTSAAKKIMDAKQQEENQYRQMEQGGLVYQYFASGGDKGVDRHGKWNAEGKFNFASQLSEYKDSLGNSLYDYLRNINQELSWQRESWGNMGVWIEGSSVALGKGGGRPSKGGSGSGKSWKRPGQPSGRSTVNFDSIRVTNKSKISSDNAAMERRASEQAAQERKFLADMAAGKGVDYRDYDIDPEVFMHNLQAQMQGSAADEYAVNVSKQANKNMVTRTMSKYAYKDEIATTKEMEAAVKKAQKEAEKGTVKLDEDESKFLGNILKKIGEGTSIVGSITGASAETMTNLLYTADQAIYNMFFKSEIKDDENGEQYDGFMDMLSKKIQKTFKDAKDTMEKNVFTPFKEAIFGWMGISPDEFKGRFTDTLKGAGSKAWGAFKQANKDVYGPAYHEIKRMAGVEEGETLAQRSRKNKRSKIAKDYEFASKNTDLFDDQFIKLLQDYGLAYTSYDTNEEAVKAIQDLLSQAMYDASKGMTEFDLDEEAVKKAGTGAKAAERARNIAMPYVQSNAQAMKSVSKKRKFKNPIKGGNVEEINDSFNRRLNRSLQDEDRRRTNTAIYGNETQFNDWLAYNGFVGDENQKREILRQMGVSEEQLAKLKTEEDLDKRFARLYRSTHAKGTSGVPFSGNTMLSKNELVFSGTGVTRVPKTGYYNISKPSHILNSEDSYNLMKSAGVSSKTLGVKSTVQQDIGRETLAAKNIAKHAEGTSNIPGVKVNNKGDIDEYLHEAKAYIPEAAAGGVIGGVTSLLLGLVGGPLVGAAVGAGTSLIAKSDKFKDIIFGKVDEKSGDRQGGIVSKTVMDTVKKYAPDAMKWGLAGIIPGLLTPLGPLGGMAVGAGIGILKNNENFTNKYFGENGKLTFSSKEKKIISNLIPGAAGGAAVGTVAGFLFGGPFGLLGNAAIGSVVGMMTTTDQFKELIIGREINGVRMGGLLGTLKDSFTPFTDVFKKFAEDMTDILDNKIVDPLKRFLVPAIHRLPRLLGTIPSLLGKAMNKAFGRDLTGRIADAIKGPLLKLVKVPLGGIKAVGNVVSLPFQALGKVGDRWTRKDIMNGYRNDMTAAERVEWMNDHGYGEDITGFDEALASVGSEGGMTVDELRQMQTNMSMLSITPNAAKKTADQKWKQIQKYIDNYKTPDGKRLDFDKKSKDRVYKLLKQGKEDEAIRELRNLTVRGEGRTLTKEEMGAFYDSAGGLGEQISSFGKSYDTYNRIKDVNAESKKKANSDLAQTFEKMGMKWDPSNPDLMKRYMALIDTELVNREAGGKGLPIDELNEENNKLFKDIASGIQELVNIQKAVITGDDKVLSKVLGESNVKNVAAEASNDAHYEAKEDQAKDMLGEETYEGLNDEAKDAATASASGFAQNMAHKVGKIPIVGSLTGLNNPNSKAYNRATKLMKRATKTKFGSAILNEVGGVGNGAEIQKLLECGFTFDEGAAKMANELSPVKMKHLNDFINGDVTAVFSGHKITEADITYCTKHSKDAKTFKLRCKYIRNGAKFEDWSKYNKTFEGIMKISPEIINNLAKRSRGITDVLSGEVVDDDEIVESTELAPLEQAGIMPAGKKSKSDVIDVDEIEGSTPLGIETSADDIPKNGLGSMILGGIGSLLGSAVKGVTSLFTGGSSSDEEDSKSKGGMPAGDRMGLMDSMKSKMLGGGGNFDETDDPNDGKDVVQIGTDFAKVKAGSDGSVELDTSDSNTRQILNKQQEEADANAKLRDAQIAAAEATVKANDTSDIKESKGGKLGWLSLLLIGGLLWKSGILQKIYENMIKPLWTEKIYPWITDKAIPWIKNTALPAIGNAISTIVTDVLPGVLSAAASGLVDLLCDALPAVLKGVFNIGSNVVGGVLDAVSGGNTTNAGGKTTVDASSKVDSGEGDTVTGMYDEYGNALTYDDIANGNYTKIYNAEGTEGTVNDDGTVTFKDSSVRGSSYAKKAVNALGHAVAHGKQGVLSKAVTKGASALSSAGKFLTGKSGSTASKVASKIPGSKLLGRVSQATSGVSNIVSAPARLGEYISTGLKNTANGVIDAASSGGSASSVIGKAVSNLGNTIKGTKVGNAVDTAVTGIYTYGDDAIKAVKNGADDAITTLYTYGDDAVKAVKNSSVGQKVGSFVSNIGSKIKTAVKGSADDVVEDVAKVAASSVDDVAEAAVEGAVKTATSGNASSKATLISKCADAIESLFGNSKVLKKITNAASSIGITKITDWVSTFKKNVTSIFDDAIEKGVEKVGSETLKKAVSKANLILTVASIVTDFLTGCDKAESILGVTETNLVEEVVAGIINAICNLLIIPSIVPGVNWIARKLYNLFGDDLTERQEEADEEYEAYKEETGSTLSKEEYLSRQYSVTGKVGGFFKNIGSKAVNTVKNAGSTVVSGVKSVGSKIKSFFTGKSSDDEEEVAENALGTTDITNLVNNLSGLSLITADGSTVSIGDVTSKIQSMLTSGSSDSTTSELIANMVGTVGNAINSADGDTLTQRVTNAAIGLVGDSATTFKEKISSGVSNLAGTVSDKISSAKDAANDASLNALSTVSSISNKLGGNSILGKALNAVNDADGDSILEKSKNAASSALNTAKSTASNLVSSLYNKITNNAEGTITADDLGLATDGAPASALSEGTDTIASGITSAITKIFGNVNNASLMSNTSSKATDTEDSVIEQVKNGELSIFSQEYWNIGSANNDDLQTTVSNTYTWMKRITNFPSLLVQTMLKSMLSGIGNIGSWISSKFSSISEFFTNPLDFIYKKITGQGEKDEDGNTNDLTSISMNEDGDLTYMDGNGSIISQYSTATDTTVTNTDTTTATTTTDTTGTTTSSGKTGFVSKVKNTFGSLFSSAKKLFGFGSGPEYVKQIDPSVANLPYNASYDTEFQTIGDSACGPAAAVNAVRAAYGRGNDLVNASNYALAGGYKEQNGGTYPEFFTDYFNANGLGSNITSNRSAIADSIRSGQPTVLMGQDANGTSSSTPFGKTSHYVTVTGTDSYGRAVVQDPESKYDNQLYDVNDLMRKTTLGISAYGKKHGRGSFGHGKKLKYVHPVMGRGIFGRGVSDSGTQINIPSGLGSVFTYMGWQCITSKTSTQYKLREQAGQNFDDEGFGIINNRYVIACTTTFGDVGDYVDFVQSDGTTFQCVIGDIKSQNDSGCTEWGHQNGKCVVEFVVDKSTWYSNGKGAHANPGSSSFHSEWGGKTMSYCINHGSYFDDPSWTGGATGQVASTNSSGTTVSSSSSSTSASDTSSSILGTLSYVLTNSKVGKLFSSLTSTSSSSSSSEDASTSASGGNKYKYKSGTGKYFGQGKFGRSKYGRGNGEKIWYALKQAGFTDYGAAGLLGNVEAESGLEPTNLQNSYEKSLGMSDSEYTNAVDNGSYTNFVNDSAGYGLVQWTYYSLKQDLLNAANAANASIGDLTTQVNFLLSELANDYSDVYNTLKNATDVTTASNKMLHDFERPADQSSSVEKKRASYGQAWYDKLKGTQGEELSGVTAPGEATSGSSSSDSDSASEESTTILGVLSNIITNSKAGQILASLTGTSSSSTTATTSSDGSSSDGSTTVLGDSDAANMVNIAKDEVGTKETGTNYVKYNDWYWGDGVGGSSYPWCAAFVSWVANQAGVSTSIVPKTASTKTSYSGITSNGGSKVSNSQARAGDIAFFSKSGTYDGIYHTGIVSGNDGSTIYTIEGNSSDQVAERSYNVGSSTVLIARPAYANQGSSSSTVNLTNSSTASDSTVGSTQGGNGYKPISKYGTFRDNISGMGSRRFQLKSNEGLAKTEEIEADKVIAQEMKSQSRKTVYHGTASGQGTHGRGTADYEALLKAIIQVLMTIADNTDKLNTVVNLLTDYTGMESTDTEVSEATSVDSLKSKVNNLLGGISGSNATSNLTSTADDAQNSSIATIMNALNAIASE